MVTSKKYIKPACNVVKITNSGFLFSSGNLGNPGDYDNGGDPFGNSPLLFNNEEINIVPFMDKSDALSMFE